MFCSGLFRNDQCADALAHAGIVDVCGIREVEDQAGRAVVAAHCSSSPVTQPNADILTPASQSFFADFAETAKPVIIRTSMAALINTILHLVHSRTRRILNIPKIMQPFHEGRVRSLYLLPLYITFLNIWL